MVLHYYTHHSLHTLMTYHKFQPGPSLYTLFLPYIYLWIYWSLNKNDDFNRESFESHDPLASHISYNRAHTSIPTRYTHIYLHYQPHYPSLAGQGTNTCMIIYIYVYITILIPVCSPHPCRQPLSTLQQYQHILPHYTIHALYTDTTYTPIIHTWPTSLHNIYLKSTPVDKHYLYSHYTYMSHLITQYLPQVNPCRQTLPKHPLYTHDPPHYTIPTPSQPL